MWLIINFTLATLVDVKDYIIISTLATHVDVKFNPNYIEDLLIFCSLVTSDIN